MSFSFIFKDLLIPKRHKRAKLDAPCEGHLRTVKTPLPTEHYAANTIFYEVQAEICDGCFECCVVSSIVDGVVSLGVLK